MKYKKRLTRGMIAPMALKAGGDKFLRSLGKNSVLNLMYHGVSNSPDHRFSPRHLSSQQFEKQIQYFTREFDIISLKDAFFYMRNSAVPKRKSISISFDDGYKNNLTTALPILKKYKVPATIFVSGVCAETTNNKILFPDFIAALYYFYPERFRSVIQLVQEHSDIIISKSNLIPVLRSLKPRERNELIDEFEKDFNVFQKIKQLPEENWRLLDEEDLRELERSGLIDIQSHGMRHHDLNRVDLEDAEDEMKNSKKLLEGILGKNITGFAYPYGSYNTELKKIAEKVGYTDQVAVQYLFNKIDNKDSRIINRYSVSATTSYSANILLMNKAFRKDGF